MTAMQQDTHMTNLTIPSFSDGIVFFSVSYSKFFSYFCKCVSMRYGMPHNVCRLCVKGK